MSTASAVFELFSPSRAQIDMVVVLAMRNFRSPSVVLWIFLSGYCIGHRSFLRWGRLLLAEPVADLLGDDRIGATDRLMA
jgi:hypothetical protein